MSYPQHDLPHDYWRVLPAGLDWMARRSGLQISELTFLGGYFTQIHKHWDTYFLGRLDQFFILKPIVGALRIAGNLVFAALEFLLPRPSLASDYLACLTKSNLDNESSNRPPPCT